ncbi:unnamed protein product [Orchesella dallaii]|uniref:C2H2-type domain-containing protein n=1 Tax=Orchesella dallaii TaxID=48710 RepID=A0ABP1RWR9_9HEXA
MKMNARSVYSNCLFCASECSPNSNNFTKQEPQVMLITADYVPTFQFVIGEVPNSAQEEEVKESNAVFILKHILGIREDRLQLYLGKLKSPIKVCDSCQPAVQTCLQVFKEISTLQNKLLNLSGELKGRIFQTINNTGAIGYQDCFWKEVRDEVVAVNLQGNTNSSAQNTCNSLPEQLATPDFSLLSHLPPPPPPFISQPDHPPPIRNERKRKTPATPEARPISSLPHQIPTYLSFKKDKRIYYKCSLCPAQYPDLTRVKTHLELHSTNSNATACSLCGWVVACDKIRFHNSRHHPVIPRLNNSASSHHNHHHQQQQQRPSLPNGHGIPIIFQGHPPYTSYKKGTRLYYKCSACPFETPDLRRMRNHLQLHFPGSKPAVCGTCGVFLEPGKLTRHNFIHHGKKKD